MQLYKRLRWEYEHGVGTIRGVARKYKVHRRTVRAALKNAVPPKRKVTPRKRPKTALAIPFIDDIRRIRSGAVCKSRCQHAISRNQLSGHMYRLGRQRWMQLTTSRVLRL